MDVGPLIFLEILHREQVQVLLGVPVELRFQQFLGKLGVALSHGCHGRLRYTFEASSPDHLDELLAV